MNVSSQSSEPDADLFFYGDAAITLKWLAELKVATEVEYAEKKDPRDRSLQTGSAWRAFLNHFHDPNGAALVFILSHLLRLTDYLNPLFRTLEHSAFPLLLEHEATGEFFGPNTPDLSTQTGQAILLARQTLERWCDWIDAELHLRAHSFYHGAPLCFDPDPDKRDLALLGTTQKYLAYQDDFIRRSWHRMLAEAADRFKNSPKWRVLGQAMASDDSRLWTYRELDTIIISLWPLLKRHNWTYRDLMQVTRSILAARKQRDAGSYSSLSSSSFSYPCTREQDFTVHCRTVLALRKSGRGKTTKSGRPPGHDVAHKLFAPPLTTT